MLLNEFSSPAFSSRAAGFCAVALMGSAGLLMPAAASAEPSPALDRFSFSLGAFRADPTFNASANTRYGLLDSGDLESSSVTLPRIRADLLLLDSQGLSFDYYRFHREYSSALARNFTVNTTSVAATGTARLDLKLDLAKLAYKWWFGTGSTVFGLGAGAAYYRAALDGSASATVNGMSGSLSGGDSDSAVAPLLEIGLRHAINPDLRLFADLSGVRKNGGRIHGDIYNAAVGIEWFPLKNAGLVLDYGMSSIDLKRDEGSSHANLRVKLKGPSAFLKVRF